MTLQHSGPIAGTSKFGARGFQVAFAVLILVLAVVAFAKRQYVSRTPIELNQSSRLGDCRSEVLNTLGSKSPDLALLGSIHGLCYARVDEEDILEEFGVRRAAYINQQYQVPIMLWMVVAITLSGVGLAGLQLWIGYKLALIGHGGFESKGELTLEPKKISVSSSITGVLILTLSLIFFYVFVQYVYLIKELKVPAPESETVGPDLHSRWGHNKLPSDIPENLKGYFPSPTGHKADSTSIKH